MNIAEAITLNSTGIIDATNGTIGFVNSSPSSSTARTVAANMFKNAVLNKMVVNLTAGVTLTPVLTIKTVDMKKGLLHIAETSQLNISHASGGSSTSYINTKSLATTGAIAKVHVSGLIDGTAVDFPLGNGGSYLPVRITPKDTTGARSLSNYTISVLKGLTSDGLPNGDAVGDKSQFVDASYHVIRTAGTVNYTIRVGFPVSLRGTAFTASTPFGISKYNGNSWGAVAGSGDFALSTATVSLNTNGLRYRVQLGGAQPLNVANVQTQANNNLKKAEVSTTLNEAKFKQNSITVYPNPVRGNIVNVSLSEELSSNRNEAKFTLYDMIGRRMNIRKEATGIGTYSISLPETLGDGVYQLVIEKNGAIVSKSILVQK